jgi:3-phosphoshikimate 1-carboxyvinyltransferase
VPSAQVKSAVLLAALGASGPSTVFEAVSTRAHTEEMLLEAGAAIEVFEEGGGRRIRLHPGELQPRSWSVPADPSQGAFFVVAGLLASTGTVVVEDLYPGLDRSGFLGVLERMGADLDVRREPSGLVVTARPSSLEGTEILSSEITSLDEVPILVIAAAAAAGRTTFRDVGELRLKESDRFAKAIELATGLGATAHGEDDDLMVDGLASPSAFESLEIASDGDHRVAMAAAIAGAVGKGATIHGFDAVATSYPGFLDVLDSLR